jgi:hypothetical protein
MQLDDKPCKGCKVMFTPKVEWQKFHNTKCHDEYWKGVHREKAATSKRLDKIEEQLNIK